MSKNHLNFFKNNPEKFDVPVHYIGIGDVKFFGFPSEIFCYFGLSLKKCDIDKRIVVPNCNCGYGYVPTRDIFYDTIYESKPSANKLDKSMEAVSFMKARRKGMSH